MHLYCTQAQFIILLQTSQQASQNFIIEFRKINIFKKYTLNLKNSRVWFMFIQSTKAKQI